MFIKDTEQVALAITPVDAAGNPAVITGTPVWSSSDTSVLTVTASTDGLSAVAASTGKLGKVTVSVSLGAISGTLDIEVHGGDAVAITISAGTASAKAPASAPAAS